MPPMRQTPARLRPGRRRTPFSRFRVEPVALAPRVDHPGCGVVVAGVPWAEPGSRSTRDFEAERAWLMTAASQRTASGFPRA